MKISLYLTYLTMIDTESLILEELVRQALMIVKLLMMKIDVMVKRKVIQILILL